MDFKESYVGDGKVYLLAGGGKVFTDIAARFVHGERSVEEICDSPYSAKIVKNILSSGHLAATEFDWFVFGIEGYSRVTEAQLIRKRHASYLIKSGRVEHGGKGTYSVVYPKAPQHGLPLEDFVADTTLTDGRSVTLSGQDLAYITKQWYEQAVAAGYKEEDARYWKPQATEFKAIIGMNCYDDKTEVLTREGWKLFSEVSLEDEFYSMNPLNREVEFVKPLRLIQKPYKGKMLGCKTRRLDFLVTPDHNSFLSANCAKYTKSNLPFSLGKTCDFFNPKNKELYATRTCKLVLGDYVPFIHLEKVDNSKKHHNGKLYRGVDIPCNEFLRFLGFYLSDGSCFKMRDSIKSGITLTKGDKKKLEMYGGMAAKWFSRPNYKIYDNKHNCYVMHMYSPQLFNFFNDLGKSYEKRIPKWVYNLSRDNLIHLLYGLMDGDANIRGRSVSYTTVSRGLADDIQRLLLHVGLSGSIRVCKPRRARSLGSHIISSKRESYVVSFTLNPHDYETVRSYDNDSTFSEDYDGNVFCVSLEKFHTLYVRRNGKPIWSGNCHALLDWFAIRCCRNAQREIRDLATKMLSLCVSVAPDLFAGAGPSCVNLGYCPENQRQNEMCKKIGKYLPKDEALEILKQHRKF